MSSSIETRLKRLEAGVADVLPDVVVEWPPEGEPPLPPGWHPELSLTVLRWPDEPDWPATARDANR